MRWRQPAVMSDEQRSNCRIGGAELRAGFGDLAKDLLRLKHQGVKRAYRNFTNCYQNFGIMKAATIAAILPQNRPGIACFRPSRKRGTSLLSTNIEDFFGQCLCYCN